MGYRRSFPKGVAFLCLLFVILVACVGMVDGFRSRRALSASLERQGREVFMEGGDERVTEKKKEEEKEDDDDYAYGTGTRKETLSEKEADKALKEGEYQGTEEYSYEDDEAPEKGVNKNGKEEEDEDEYGECLFYLWLA